MCECVRVCEYVCSVYVRVEVCVCLSVSHVSCPFESVCMSGVCACVCVCVCATQFAHVRE